MPRFLSGCWSPLFLLFFLSDSKVIQEVSFSLGGSHACAILLCPLNLTITFVAICSYECWLLFCPPAPNFERTECLNQHWNNYFTWT